MVNTQAFDEHTKAYDEWFDNHSSLYELELKAVRRLLPSSGKGIEIGIGTGRFAEPFGIKVGIEPSAAMREIAQKRGLEAIDGVAEKLPIESATFDYALFVTTICFVDSLNQSFKEAYRILKPNGVIVIGFIEKNSPLGREYQTRKASSRFYSEADFYSIDDVLRALEYSGFSDFSFVQTLFPEGEETETAPFLKEGYGEGAFVVVRAKKTTLSE